LNLIFSPKDPPPSTKVDFDGLMCLVIRAGEKCSVITRVAPESGSGQNPAFFPNPAPGKILPEPEAIAGC